MPGVQNTTVRFISTHDSCLDSLDILVVKIQWKMNLKMVLNNLLWVFEV